MECSGQVKNWFVTFSSAKWNNVLFFDIKFEVSILVIATKFDDFDFLGDKLLSSLGPPFLDHHFPFFTYI